MVLNSKWIFAAFTECVIAPIEIAFIPVGKYGSILFKLIPPLTSIKIDSPFCEDLISETAF